MEKENNEPEYEEVILKIPKNSMALIITSIYMQNKGMGMNTQTYDTEQIKGIERYNKETE